VIRSFRESSSTLVTKPCRTRTSPSPPPSASSSRENVQLVISSSCSSRATAYGSVVDQLSDTGVPVRSRNHSSRDMTTVLVLLPTTVCVPSAPKQDNHWSSSPSRCW
jgi:hypothetical protein